LNKKINFKCEVRPPDYKYIPNIDSIHSNECQSSALVDGMHILLNVTLTYNLVSLIDFLMADVRIKA